VQLFTFHFREVPGVTAKRASIAKISTPRLFGVVARERLFVRLDENRGRPVIWIEGPPGAGKTTLVASYLEARSIPTLWYQVDPGDADPANLFHYIAIAAASLLGIDTLALPRLVPEHLSDLPAFGRTFFRELFAHLPSGAVVVLDNYQEVSATASLQEILLAIAGEVPPDSSIIGVSRIEPPGSFARLAGSGSLFSLRWDTLRLTLEETRAMSAARDIRDDWLVRALHLQSEGWAAGITLMLERLGQVGADAGTLPTDTRESVFDYFASLLFDQAPAELRHALLSVAFMPHMTASMAETLSGRAEAGRLLDDLCRRHLFTDRRPGPEPVYQFHALFRDFLQRRAAESMLPSEVERAIARSAQLLEDHGDIELAMNLRLVAQDWDEAERMISREATDLLKSGRWQTLERWIQDLPPDRREFSPRLLYWLGMAQVPIEPARGLATLVRAREEFRGSSDRAGRTLCLAALLNVGQLGHVAVPVADEWLGDLLAEVERSDLTLPQEAELPVWSAIVAALFYWRPWHALAQEARQRVQRLLVLESDPTAALAAASTALVSDTTTGNLEAADQIVSLVEPLARRPEASPSAGAWFFYGAAYLRFVQTRYEESLSYFDAACNAASASGLQESLSDITLYRLMVEFRVSGWAVANATLRAIEALPLPRRPMSLALLRIYQARRAHFHDRWGEAADLAKSGKDAINRVAAPQFLMSFGLFNAEVLIGAGCLEDARPLLARSREIVQRSPALDCWHAAVVFCGAFLARAESRHDVCLTMLREALRLARVGNRKYYLRYLECCMPPLFCLALEEGIEVDLVQRLIGMFRLKAPADAHDHWPRPVRIQTLGRFEIRIKEEALEFSRKVPKKTLALLKALIAHGAEVVPEQWLCDALWGDEEADSARLVLGVTVLRLRKLLGYDDAIGQQGGKVWLDRRLCWVDAWRFEALSGNPFDRVVLRNGLNLYAGAFLAEDEAEAWSVPMRERLRGKFIHALATCGQALEADGHADEAIRLYLLGIDADVIVEAFHRGLMRCYRCTGRMTEAVSAYRRLRKTMSVVLGVSPSAESEALYREIIAGLAADSVEARLAGSAGSDLAP
jgi:LuxR family transcriptional regulator, maltose regulon positive regulatory protein